MKVLHLEYISISQRIFCKNYGKYYNSSSNLSCNLTAYRIEDKNRNLRNMNINQYFTQARTFIAQEEFDQLNNLKLEKPDHFNWVRDIFEPLNVTSTPNAKALLWRTESEEQHFTFQEISNLSNQLLNFLRSKGIQKSDLIYTQLPLVPANWICYLTAIKGGFIVIPAATTLVERDISYRFEKSFPQVVIADEANAIKIDEAEKMSGQKITVKLITDTEREGWFHLNSIITSEDTSAEAAHTNSNDPLFYFFTSGTTGMPKVVIHTHFTYPVGHLSTASWLGVRAGDVHYNISQPGWAKFAWSSFFAPWNVGATIFANNVKKFDAIDQLKTIEKYGISTFCSPPTALRMFIQQDLSKYDLKLRQCVAAGEPLNPEVIEKWKNGTNTLIRDGYGQTESTCLVCNTPNAPVKYGSMGKPTFMYDIVIADDDGHEVPDTEEGNICLRVSSDMINGLFIGYKDDEERQKKVFRNGLYYTGDKAYRDEDGYIWFVGRDDDVIKASDFRIGPFEIESLLIEHDAVIEAAVVASPHKMRGFSVKAFVVLKEGFSSSEALAQELFDFAEKHLAKYKIPRIIEFVDEFPKTISGKIRRIELRANEAVARSKNEHNEREFFHEKY